MICRFECTSCEAGFNLCERCWDNLQNGQLSHDASHNWQHHHPRCPCKAACDLISKCRMSGHLRGACFLGNRWAQQWAQQTVPTHCSSTSQLSLCYSCFHLSVLLAGRSGTTHSMAPLHRAPVRGAWPPALVPRQQGHWRACTRGTAFTRRAELGKASSEVSSRIIGRTAVVLCFTGCRHVMLKALKQSPPKSFRSSVHNQAPTVHKALATACQSSRTVMWTSTDVNAKQIACRRRCGAGKTGSADGCPHAVPNCCGRIAASPGCGKAAALAAAAPQVFALRLGYQTSGARLPRLLQSPM